MAKLVFLLEETISQKFELDNLDSIDKIREMYKTGQLVLDEPQVSQVLVNILDEHGEETDWIDLHI